MSCAEDNGQQRRRLRYQAGFFLLFLLAPPLDLFRLDAGVTRRVNAAWLVSGRIGHAWLRFPGLCGPTEGCSCWANPKSPASKAI